MNFPSIALLLLLLFFPPAGSVAMPSVLNKTNLIKAGEGKLTWFGLSIYNASLWTSENAIYANLYDSDVLLIADYDRNISNQRILNSISEEWKRINSQLGLNEQLWMSELDTIIPNILSGDKLSSFVRANGSTKFYLNDQYIGEIQDPKFGPAFLSIWLNKKTSKKRLRKDLLGDLIQDDAP
ncbi:MAG: chalcone isomerase family protein [Pseudomonadota bacterium]|nr:chalcone isomerase family protein [Pseudomonadota bacterium]